MLFMTGGAFTERARAFLESVPNRFLEKPFDLAQLESAVRSVAAN
jgi:CheY-like chemotaxis protein